MYQKVPGYFPFFSFVCAVDALGLYLITLLAIMNLEIGAKFFDSPTYGFFMFSDKKIKDPH